MTPRELLELSPVIPVVAIDKLEHAVPLAQALLAGGLNVLEITLRTKAALRCIEDVRTAVPDMVVGAGTVLDPPQAQRAREAGAQFLVSPGATDALLSALAAQDGVPWLPGAATTTESMRLREAGLVCQKFFPAEISGGAAWLAAVAPVLPDVVFCPTGGITAAKAGRYLALPNVLAVGGSWMAPSAAVGRGEFARIKTAARETAMLGRGLH